MEKYIIIAKNASDTVKNNLVKMGYSLIPTIPLENVHPAIKYHPDMQIVKAQGCYVCATEVFDYYKPFFDKMNIKLVCGAEDPKEKYPFDVLYNAAVFGEFCVHNFEFSDKAFLTNINCKKINVNQGYTKCSLCVVGDRAVITSDVGIKDKLIDNGIDVLLIQKGFITLEPFEYGFIGGASGLLNKNTLCFAGDISLHPDFEKIRNFCGKYNVRIINLSEEKPTDIGTITVVG